MNGGRKAVQGKVQEVGRGEITQDLGIMVRNVDFSVLSYLLIKKSVLRKPNTVKSSQRQPHRMLNWKKKSV